MTGIFVFFDDVSTLKYQTIRMVQVTSKNYETMS